MRRPTIASSSDARRAAATFHFTAPRSPCAARAARRRRGTARPRAARRATPRPLRILLAEDNPVNQRLAPRLLEKHGARASTLRRNGREAVDALRRASASTWS